MKLCRVLLSLEFLLLTATAKVAKLPKNLVRCSWKLQPSELNECLRNAIQDGHEKLKDGDSSINVVKLEPLIIPEIKIGQNDQGPVRISIIQRDVKIYGVASAVKVEKYFVNFDERIMGGQFFYPQLTLVTNQTTDGQILLVPIKGTGNSTFKIDKYRSNFTINFEITTKNGYHYLKFDGKKFDYNLNVGRISFSVDNLFNGDKQLGDATNKVINDNWELLFTEMKPIYEITFKKLLIEALNKFFGKVPLEEVLLDFKLKE